MRKLLLGSGVVAGLVAFGAAFGACGGSEDIKKDGGPDGDNMMTMPDGNTMMPDGNMMMEDSGMDLDAGADVVVDAGPKCTNVPCVVGLSVGGHHACAIINDGTVRCWGQNTRGQLGNLQAGVMNRSVPVVVDNVGNATQVGTSTIYTSFGVTCVRQSSGAVLCFGDNQVAQLGLNADAGVPDNAAHIDAGQVQGLPMSNNVRVGNYHACAASAANEYWCWGSNTNFLNTLGRNFMGNFGAAGKATSLADAGAIASGWPGSDFNVALTSTGTVYSWGSNQQGQLGRQTNQQSDANPAPVTNLANVTQVSAGQDHACAVTQAGQVYCWGGNSYAQLGRGIQGGSSNQAQVVNVGKTVTQVATSNFHTCVVATDGTVYCWGRNNAGQVGPNSMDGGLNPQAVTTPLAIMGLPGKALAVGTGGTNLQNGTDTGYSCALIEGGSVYCWGYNGESELGRGMNPMGVTTCPSVFNGASCSPNPDAVVWQ